MKAMDYKTKFDRWLENVDDETKAELKRYTTCEAEDAFFRNLVFGTGGLRGIIGAGANRMNVYTVGKASQGLADYLNRSFCHSASCGDSVSACGLSVARPSVVIGYDSRIKSVLFARTAASVFAANGIRVNIWSNLLPVPTVSFAVRYLGASAGVMITASHNPAEYNGYKVYGMDGCQITTEAAAAIQEEMEKVDIFDDVKKMDFDLAVSAGQIISIPDEVLTAYIENVKSQSVLFGENINKDVVVTYSPLNGTGLVPVTRALKELGYTNIIVVRKQEQPDGNFPTCPYPNPELREAMELGIKCARESNADLLLATDPDCDRVGVAVNAGNGEYALLSGNEIGILLLDYICSQRKKHGKMPTDPVMIKTIVTTDLGERIATHYGIETRNVLTGFKFIGEQIGELEKEKGANRFVFGFEESCGYLSGSYVRDKDGVNAACLICEMFSFYRTRGISLLERLCELYREYGYILNTLYSYDFKGATGFARMQEIMKKLRKDINEIGHKKVERILDYSKGVDGLPRADVLKYLLEGKCSVVVRPSGTEPKLKIYISVCAGDMETAKEMETQIAEHLEGLVC